MLYVSQRYGKNNFYEKTDFTNTYIKKTRHYDLVKIS